MIEELRIKEWMDKFFLVMVCCLLVSLNLVGFEKILIFSIYLLIIEQYIYLLNSFCDKDRKIFKENTTKSVLYILAGLSLIIPILIKLSYLTSSLTIITLFFSTYYSMPPLRFKKRGFLGLTGAFAQYVFPFLVFCSFFSIWDTLSIFLIIYLSLIASIKLIVHQIDDYDEDKKNKIKTMVIQIGKIPSKIIIYFLILFLVLSYLMIFMFFSLNFAITASVLLFIFSTPSFLYIKKVMLNE